MLFDFFFFLDLYKWISYFREKAPDLVLHWMQEIFVQLKKIKFSKLRKCHNFYYPNFSPTKWGKIFSLFTKAKNISPVASKYFILKLQSLSEIISVFFITWGWRMFGFSFFGKHLEQEHFNNRCSTPNVRVILSLCTMKEPKNCHSVLHTHIKSTYPQLE